MVSTQIPSNFYLFLRRFFCLTAVLFCVVLALGGCKGKTHKKTPKPGDKIYPVAAFRVPMEEVSQSLELKGTFVPSDKLDVKSEVDGKFSTVSVTEGQSVNVGDPLGTINPEQLQIQLERQRAELREAEGHAENEAPRNLGGLRNFGALRGMRGLQNLPGVGSPAAEAPSEAPAEEEQPLEEGAEAPNLDETGEAAAPEPSQPPVAEALPEKPEALQRAENTNLDRIRADIALTEKKIESANVTAAIAGIVSKKNVAEGSVVTPGEILFQIVKLDPIWISVFVPSETAAALKTEEKPDVMPEDLPDSTISGDLVFVSPEPDPQNKNYEVRVSIPNTQLKIKGGMAGKVLLPVSETRKVVTVPEDAVLQKGGARYVYVVQDQVAEKRELSLGKKFSGKFEVKRGLKEGEAVVIKGQQDLKEDQEFVKVESL